MAASSAIGLIIDAVFNIGYDPINPGNITFRNSIELGFIPFHDIDRGMVPFLQSFGANSSFEVSDEMKSWTFTLKFGMLYVLDELKADEMWADLGNVNGNIQNNMTLDTQVSYTFPEEVFVDEATEHELTVGLTNWQIVKY